MAYEKMVGDQDSAMHNRVQQRNPYGALAIQVEKVDCTNHYVKRFRYLYDRLKNVPIDEIDRKDPKVTLKGKHGLSRSFQIFLAVPRVF